MGTHDVTDNQAMVPKRQLAENTLTPTAGSKLKSIRLDLSEEDHHALRLAAAHENTSMAAYARKVVSDAVKRYRPSRRRESGK
jgi:hypothetical protein